jgi:hypothetical protein
VHARDRSRHRCRRARQVQTQPAGGGAQGERGESCDPERPAGAAGPAVEHGHAEADEDEQAACDHAVLLEVREPGAAKGPLQVKPLHIAVVGARAARR